MIASVMWKLVRNNWAGLLFAGLLLAVFIAGWRVGDKNATLECQATIYEMQQAQQSEKDRLQRRADRLSQQYEKQRQKTYAALSQAKKRLAHVQKENAAFTDCHAGADFMQLYTDTIRSCAAGHTPR